MEKKELIGSNFNFMTFGRQEIGTPKVDEYFGTNEWISFGLNNDYPQELIRLYQNASSLHTAIINRKVQMIAGRGFKEVPELKEFMSNQFSKENLDEIAYKLAFDEVLFGGYYLNVIWNKTGDKIAQIEHVPFEKVRVGKPYEETTSVECFFVSKNWSKWRKQENKPEKIEAFDAKKSKEFPSQLLQVKIYSPGMEYYSIPTYQSSLNWIKLDWEISTFHLKQVQNGLMPGMVIVNKMGIPPAEERDKIYNEVKNRYSGAENAGDFIMVFAESAEKAPEFIPIQLNDSDQKFKDLGEQINNNIMRAHNFTSAIAGIETAGKLGSKQELIEQLETLQVTVIEPLQIVINRTFNKLASINSLPQTFELQEYQMFKSEPISPAIATTEQMSDDDLLDKESKARLKGTVGGVQGIISIKQAVVQGIMEHDSANAMLQLIYGYSAEDCDKILGLKIK